MIFLTDDNFYASFTKKYKKYCSGKVLKNLLWQHMKLLYFELDICYPSFLVSKQITGAFSFKSFCNSSTTHVQKIAKCLSI
jgi:hypothetical protein